MVLDRSTFGPLIGRAAAAAYLCLFPLVGLVVAYIGFCDPDTCWHLALGKWMSEHHQLPCVDPFSSNIRDFVFVAAGRPIMQHEWLSDWIFYGIYCSGGASSLLACVAGLSTLALVILPALVMVKDGTPRLLAVACILATLPACLFRLWVRPEIFSFAYLSGLIWLVETGCLAKARRFWLCLPATFVVLALWANCHALFVLGLIYMVLYLGLTIIQVLANLNGESRDRAEGSKRIVRVFSLTLAALGGSLCTPWQGALWLYVFKIVFSPAAHGNKENGPLQFSDIGHITVVPLAVSFIFVGVVFARLLWCKKVSIRVILLPIGLYISAVACALLVRRFTPFAMLILLASAANLFQTVRRCWRSEKLEKPDLSMGDGHQSISPRDLLEQWTIDGQRLLGRLSVPGLTSGTVGLLLTVATTWLAANFLIRPEIPAPSRFFTPACQALQLLSKLRPAGRMLNDSKLGSMMTFCLVNPPDIFIDGRFDSYSRQLIDDYQQMRLAKPGYLDLLNSYHIDWVFFPPATPLVDSLVREPGWRVYYRGRDAVILTRVVGRP